MLHNSSTGDWEQLVWKAVGGATDGNPGTVAVTLLGDVTAGDAMVEGDTVVLGVTTAPAEAAGNPNAAAGVLDEVK